MTVAVYIPARITDDHRAAALEYVQGWYTRHLPGVPLILCTAPGDVWSKGAAIAAGRAYAPEPGVMVIADADSFLTDPSILAAAIEMVSMGGAGAVTPHRRVYRLTERESTRITATPGARPRLGHTARPAYEGPIGGGITVVSAKAFDTVHGVDPRFEGWGGEDICFGWALETLSSVVRLDGVLVHLWHPHPAPTLRGSPESEALVARYRDARLVPRRMEAVVAGDEWEPAEPLAEPVRFRMKANRTSLRLPNGDVVRFTGPRRDARTGGAFETYDPDIATMLRTFRIVTEEAIR